MAIRASAPPAAATKARSTDRRRSLASAPPMANRVPSGAGMGRHPRSADRGSSRAAATPVRARGQRSQLTAEPRASPARPAPGGARPPGDRPRTRRCWRRRGQGDVAGRQQPGGPFGGRLLPGAVARGPAAEPHHPGPGPAATSSRLSAAAAVSTISFSAPLRVVRAGRGERSLGRRTPATARPGRPGSAPGRRRPSWPPPPRRCSSARAVEGRRAAQRTQRAGHRQGQEPASRSPVGALGRARPGGRPERVQPE